MRCRHCFKLSQTHLSIFFLMGAGSSPSCFRARGRQVAIVSRAQNNEPDNHLLSHHFKINQTCETHTAKPKHANSWPGLSNQETSGWGNHWNDTRKPELTLWWNAEWFGVLFIFPRLCSYTRMFLNANSCVFHQRRYEKSNYSILVDVDREARRFPDNLGCLCFPTLCNHR